ncbi:MAG: hypothetical protein BZY77_00590 [SAR202 cluster bacterium Io17-Chloro-G5]|nr:MAG: hypothetical protein BZY77_00590 [SAR202 cluster bacterium Io17-Chloro-G5]
MGGAITLLYALRYPEELKGIILMGTGARPYVNPDKMERCRQPGPENSEWLAGYMSLSQESPQICTRCCRKELWNLARKSN